MYEQRPRLAIAAGLRVVEPALDRLAGGARVIARWQEVLVDRSPGAEWTVVGLVPQVRKVRQIMITIGHGRTIDLPAIRRHDVKCVGKR